jgi:hypothetical protein
MSKTVKHTPTPWRTTKTQPNVVCNSGGDKWIARATIGHSKSPRFIADADIAEANAAFIVKAVNCHDDLLNELEVRDGDLYMLRKAVEAGDPKAELLVRIDTMIRETKIALAKAEGRS